MEYDMKHLNFDEEDDMNKIDQQIIESFYCYSNETKRLSDGKTYGMNLPFPTRKRINTQRINNNEYKYSEHRLSLHSFYA